MLPCGVAAQIHLRDVATDAICLLSLIWALYVFVLRQNMNTHTRALAEKIWLYHHLNHALEKADAILVLCSHDLLVAERGAQLLLDGFAPLLVFSGGLGSITKAMWSKPEADQFAEIAIRMGVPEERIPIENRSTNTGENVLFTRQLLAEKAINIEKFIVVQKPYMERRSYATFRKLWRRRRFLLLRHRCHLMNIWRRIQTKSLHTMMLSA